MMFVCVTNQHVNHLQVHLNHPVYYVHHVHHVHVNVHHVYNVHMVYDVLPYSIVLVLDH